VGFTGLPISLYVLGGQAKLGVALKCFAACDFDLSGGEDQDASAWPFSGVLVGDAVVAQCDLVALELHVGQFLAWEVEAVAHVLVSLRYCVQVGVIGCLEDGPDNGLVIVPVVDVGEVLNGVFECDLTFEHDLRRTLVPIGVVIQAFARLRVRADVADLDADSGHSSLPCTL